MADSDNLAELQALGAFLRPLARLMLELDLPLRDGVEVLKQALVAEALDRNPDASASHLSLMTGVHRKDIRRFEDKTPAPRQSIAAARVLSQWQNDPDFAQNGAPRPLIRGGETGFDALVKRAKVDAAPATVLSLLIEAGNVHLANNKITFLSASLVPEDRAEKLRAAIATVVPHLRSSVGNVAGGRPQWDQALRYSHLTETSARTLETEAARLSLDLLKTLDRIAFDLQQEEEGTHLFVAGTYTHIEDQSE
jgi:hypothetical protein